MSKPERSFQPKIIKRLYSMYPNKCVVLKTDPTYIQGIPDLICLIGKRWLALEVKKSANEPFRPNQKFYIKVFNKLSFARVIYPENEERVFSEIQQTFRP